MVDQLRQPRWFPHQRQLDRLLPNISGLQRRAVSFNSHYTAANDCTPARAALLTGLYPHQTGCLITGRSTLDPAFPTWGTALREQGYRTAWFGKWHVTHNDNLWRGPSGRHALERYGFGGGTFPSPDGAPGQGLVADPQIATQFAHWLAAEGADGPWCTTVSFVNPHDIEWWPRFTDRLNGERAAPAVFNQLPPNFETPDELVARRKPSLQLAFSQTSANSFGAVPFSGPGTVADWTEFMDLYLHIQRVVDVQVGRVLGALAAHPHAAANTVVIFTADHGEYGASHGLRGKGGAAYDEALHVPLAVYDPRGRLTAATDQPRRQLTSSVDLMPLLLTVSSGSNAWRQEPKYAHLAQRADLAAMLKDPQAPGREAIAHVTDEIATEYAPTMYGRLAPHHVIALRTPTAKYVTYSHWRHRTDTIVMAGQERELYDYTSAGGRLELDNIAGHSALEADMDRRMQNMIRDELRAQLPTHLLAAQRRGFADYQRVIPARITPPPGPIPVSAARPIVSPRAQSPGYPGRRLRRGRRRQLPR